MELWNLCYCKYLLLSASHRFCWVDIYKYRSQLRNAVQVKQCQKRWTTGCCFHRYIWVSLTWGHNSHHSRNHSVKVGWVTCGGGLIMFLWTCLIKATTPDSQPCYHSVASMERHDYGFAKVKEKTWIEALIEVEVNKRHSSQSWWGRMNLPTTRSWSLPTSSYFPSPVIVHVHLGKGLHSGPSSVTSVKCETYL